MTINPIAFAEDVNRQFLRYQLTAFPLSDPDMNHQAREMLGQGKRDSQLVKGPYISLSRPFAKGRSLDELVSMGLLHPSVAKISRQVDITSMYAHQQAAFEAVKEGKHCLVSTGTGSGKTEAFLYPILDHCFEIKESNGPKGIVAIVVYPMNALAQDQLERMRTLLAGTGVTFGMYVGSTPDTNEAATEIQKMKEGDGPDKIAEYKQRFISHPNIAIVPYEERISETEMREDPPRILLTNVNQLEFLMTRGKDLGMFSNAPLRFIVFDEAHTYTGTRGAEVSLLIRRLRAFCNKTSDEVICIGTSATISDPREGPNAAKRFAERFFGVDPEKVVQVKEIYDEQTWTSSRVRPEQLGIRSRELFQEALNALDGEVEKEDITVLLESISSQVVDAPEDWKSALFDALSANEVVKTIYDVLSEPKPLSQATKDIWSRLHRGTPNEDSEFEVLTYLALGAAAERDGMPLLRPQMHYFVRGLGGAAATLKEVDGKTMANLYFTMQKAVEIEREIDPHAIFPVLSCKNCGQHFFETWIPKITEGDMASSGLLEGDNTYWNAIPEGEGTRIIFTNRFVSELDDLDDAEEYTKKLDEKRDLMFICRSCGSLHLHLSEKCQNIACGRMNSLVPVFVLKEHDQVKHCPSCGHKGGKSGSRSLSPLRPLSAVHVADVHILAQDMINSTATTNRKLIVFADNRQDAAFQAAWMADHARRYRLRHIIYRIVSESKEPQSIGDVQRKLTKILKEDKDLAHTLAPEVFASEIEESYSGRINESMQKFLRITLIRELVMSFSKHDNLESWGKSRVVYNGINENDEAIKSMAIKYHIGTDELLLGIENLLDVFRRQRLFYDELEPIFSHYWNQGDEEVLRGFLPYFEFAPMGLKLEREDGDLPKYVKGLISSKGQTAYRGFVKKWGIEEEQVDNLLTDIWTAFTQKWNILRAVNLTSSAGKVLSGSIGIFQVDSAKVGVIAQNVRYRCSVCGRIHTRNTPKSKCTSLHCRGRLVEEEPPEDDYNISLLNRDFEMLVAREHTAQVPATDRHHIEQEFKREDGSVNCLVATPTLELGVDIGSLDMVLMRNMPPLSSNYWQRAGRAGRRHRMAVVYTYCRKSVHDEYFFEDPMRILSGKITPPRFNMRNPVMIEKHVHATVLSDLFKSIQKEDADPARVQIMNRAFPPFIRDYLIEENKFREKPIDVSPLNEIIVSEKENIKNHMIGVFHDHWPIEAADETTEARIDERISHTVERLSDQIAIIHQRMQWALITRNKLSEKERQVVKLDEMERRTLNRCRDYLSKLSENDLNNYTLNVLAREGFLPGYAMSQGSVTAFVGRAYSSTWQRISFDLPRPSTIAVREFVPGNLIYANGGKYKASLYRLPIDKERIDPDKYIIDVNTQSAHEETEKTSDYASDSVQIVEGIPICDLDLAFTSHVSDEEQNRFRMPVFMVGLMRDEHRGIDLYRIKGPEHKEMEHVHGHRIRLINVGPTDLVQDGKIGYPICTGCGATRSPYASNIEIERFKELHKQRCGKEPSNLALTSEAQVDGLLFKNIEDDEKAINLVEGLRIAASIGLEMDPEDLQTLVMPQLDGTVDVLLYDPMPGGSGLIDQIIDSWQDILKAGINAMNHCPGSCLKSCYSCMKTYRNMVNHEILDRKVAVDMMNSYLGTVEQTGKVPPKTSGTKTQGQPTNTAEMRLAKLLKEHSYTEFDPQKRIDLPKGRINSTVPDFYYESIDHRIKCAIYLDGLSRAIHGNVDRQNMDRFIRATLESMGIRVVVIAATDLDDPEMMDMHYASISRIING
ncbi:MAG: DEAD/DEAH box helicase [Methanomassiliicoccales archaeon]|jgi:ATP-dependent helicase YprA (DUF1998 family)